jgi:hypothetical protein
MNEEKTSNSSFELWLHDLSIDPANRVAGAILIISGSALGAMLGVLFTSICSKLASFSCTSKACVLGCIRFSSVLIGIIGY